MLLSHILPIASASFDDPNLIGASGLVSMMKLAENAGLPALVGEHVRLPTDKGSNPGLKVFSFVAGMVAGADSIDDMALLRHGAMGKILTRPYAPSTLGSLLRTFTFGHVRQLDAVASRLLIELSSCTQVLGSVQDTDTVFVDVDDTIIEVADPRNKQHKKRVQSNGARPINKDAWEGIDYPSAIFDEAAQVWVSNAEVGEVPYTAFTSKPQAQRVKGRLVVRRIPELSPQKTAAGQDPLFDLWRYHAFFTTTPAEDFDTVAADKTHRSHAVIENVHADLKNSALGHISSSKFAANAAWTVLATIAFNPLPRRGQPHSPSTHKQMEDTRKSPPTPAALARPEAHDATPNPGSPTPHTPRRWIQASAPMIAIRPLRPWLGTASGTVDLGLA